MDTGTIAGTGHNMTFNTVMINHNPIQYLFYAWELFACITILCLFFIVVFRLRRQDVSPADMNKIEFLLTIEKYLVLSLFGLWAFQFSSAFAYTILCMPLPPVISSAQTAMLIMNIRPVCITSFAVFIGTILILISVTLFAYRRMKLKENTKPLSD
ncbi:MAG TPA: hypothetical protein DET40_01630 [Lentisphaeria bacterium]|nr:MAG: hypothetical protein A2X45_17090 [Lentisphaerae bacterium GWF2_50_93]HCE42234.1 hypothetical protein [Lentisphaeria bacterium]